MSVARRRRAPGTAAVSSVVAGYARQAELFGALLGRLSPVDWHAPVQRHGTVGALVHHLAGNDGMVAADLGLPAEAGDVEASGRRWRAQADRLLGRLARIGPDDLDRPVRLAGRTPVHRPLRDALVQRVFETWTHADDIRHSLRLPSEPPPPEELYRIVDLGVRLLPAAMAALGRDPAWTARLVLTGPAAGTWLVPASVTATAPVTASASVTATVTADSVRFCQLLANRRTAATLPHTVDGDPALAHDLLRAAATLGCD